MKMSPNTHSYHFEPRHYQPGEPGYIDHSRPRPGPPTLSSARSVSSLSYYTSPSSTSSRRSSSSAYTPHAQRSSSRSSRYPESVHSGYASSIGSYASAGYAGPSVSPDGRDRWVPPQPPSVTTAAPSVASLGTIRRGGARSDYSSASSRTASDGASSRRSSLLSGSSGWDSGYRSYSGGSVRTSVPGSSLRGASTHSSSSSRYLGGGPWPINSINWVVDPTRKRV